MPAALVIAGLVACGSGPEAQDPSGGGTASTGGQVAAGGGSGGSEPAGSGGDPAEQDAAAVVGSGGAGEPFVAGPATEEGCDSGLWRDGVQVCDGEPEGTCRASWDEADQCFLQSNCGEPACKMVPPPGRRASRGRVPDCVCSCP